MVLQGIISSSVEGVVSLPPFLPHCSSLFSVQEEGPSDAGNSLLPVDQHNANIYRRLLDPSRVYSVPEVFPIAKP